MQTLNQQGLGVVQALLTVIIIGIIGGTGYYVYDSSQQANDSLTKAGSSTEALPVNKKSSKNAPEAKTTQTGTISGQLSYPSEGIPPLSICAEEVKSKEKTCIKTEANQRSYTMKVAVGTYNVYAMVQNGQGAFATYKAYYNEFYKCGLNVNCPAAGHTQYIVVPVEANKEKSEVNPGDWYATKD